MERSYPSGIMTARTQRVFTVGEMVKRALREKKQYSGPGLMEFLDDANVVDYSPGGNSLDMMVEQINDLWVDRVDPQERKITLYTNKAGLELFNKQVKEMFPKVKTVADMVRQAIKEARKPVHSILTNTLEQKMMGLAYFEREIKAVYGV